MRAWVIAGLMGALAVALSSGVQPWIDAGSGAFNPPDIAQDVAAARLFATGRNPYGPEIREMHSQLTGLPVEKTFPYFPHPPFSLILSWYSAYIPLKKAVLVWFACSLGLVFILAALLADAMQDSGAVGRAQPLAPVLGLFALLMAWPPILYNLEKGQWSILLAVLLGLAWRALARGGAAQAGGWLGAAASVKIFPVLLGGYLLLRARRGIAWFLGIGLVTTAIPLAIIGVGAIPDLVRNSQLNMAYWQTFPSVMYSLHGVFARLLIGGPWAHPLVIAPTVARILELIVTVALILLAVRVTIIRRGAPEPDPWNDASFAAWLVLLPLLNPQSMGHNGVLLALPLVLTARLLRHDRRTWPKAVWAAGLVLASIPRQTLWTLAPAPTDPLEGIAILALPMWGALLLFAVAIAVAGRRIDSSAPPT